MHQDDHPGLEMNIQWNSNVIVRAFISSSRENAHVFTINQSHHIFFGKALRCSVSTSALTHINQHGATSLKPSVKDCRVQNRNTKEEWEAFTCTHTHTHKKTLFLLITYQCIKYSMGESIKVLKNNS